MEKGTSQFCWSAGQCGAMRRVVHVGMPRGCPLPTSLREITSFSKKPSFLGNHSKYVGNQQPRPRPRTRHAAKGVGGEGDLAKEEEEESWLPYFNRSD